MLIVHINGVKQIPGIEYTSCKNALSFSVPPRAGDVIHISSSRGTVGTLFGDGSTYLYQLTIDIVEHENIMNLLNDVGKYYQNPAVADVLEKLKVVIELVKDNDPIRQR
jgi:hypothetical protein